MKFPFIRGGLPFGEHRAKVGILDFPVEAQLNFVWSDVPKTVKASLDEVSLEQVALSMVGPTVEEVGSEGIKGPNNGCFRDGVVISPFMETKPKGGRRGAIGFREDGGFDLLTDQEKWELVENGFHGYGAVVGTSCFFTSEDEDFSGIDALNNSQRSRVSYLVRYRDITGRLRICYFNTEESPVPRSVVKKVIDAHMDQIDGQEYIAVELELYGSGCVGKKLGEIDTLMGFAGGSSRNDHYIITFPD